MLVSSKLAVWDIFVVNAHVVSLFRLSTVNKDRVLPPVTPKLALALALALKLELELALAPLEYAWREATMTTPHLSSNPLTPLACLASVNQSKQQNWLERGKG